MRRLIVSMFCALSLTTGTAALADDDPVVVELYTSQGCSSCPPADALLGKLAARPDVIALALHVDYWDYIGWKDAFARPEWTRRQKNYAITSGRRSVYTPQMIVGGQEDVVGNRPMDVTDLIAKHARAADRADLDVVRNGRSLTIRVSPEAGNLSRALIQVVRYRPHATVAIKRGENAGRTLTYHNIVQSWDVVAKWNGKAAREFNTTLPDDTPAVVIIQTDRWGPVLAAARVK